MSDTPDRARTCEDDGEQHNWVHSSLGIPGFPWLVQCSVCRAYDKRQMQADYERDVAAAEVRGWNAAVEAARAAALGPLMHDDSCCSSGCTEQHWTEWDSRQRLLAALGQPVADLGSRPESRCDESCNCIAAPFAAAVAALRKPTEAQT